MSSNMTPVIAIAMADPVDPSSSPSIPNALRRMAAARERLAVERYIDAWIAFDHPYASDAFRARKRARMITAMERMFGYSDKEADREVERIRGRVK